MTTTEIVSHRFVQYPSCHAMQLQTPFSNNMKDTKHLWCHDFADGNVKILGVVQSGDGSSAGRSSSQAGKVQQDTPHLDDIMHAACCRSCWCCCCCCRGSGELELIAEFFFGLECVLREELGNWGIHYSFSSDWAWVLAEHWWSWSYSGLCFRDTICPVSTSQVNLSLSLSLGPPNTLLRVPIRWVCPWKNCLNWVEVIFLLGDLLVVVYSLQLQAPLRDHFLFS